uniref:Ectonucleoside triphosphate diphosphohydrolase 5 n=1 Tax=Timema monikensis TaxID=170555 RepID=A0A7R9E159_9NEOP|nr:unnamed protein product [Timema monikensis]
MKRMGRSRFESRSGSYNDALPWNVNVHAVNTLDKLAFLLGLQKQVYGIIIDAGSTGSRVLAFTFHETYLDRTLKLDSELFVQVKPGLSSYADNPKKAQVSVASYTSALFHSSILIIFLGTSCLGDRSKLCLTSVRLEGRPERFLPLTLPGAESLEELLDRAKSVIPPADWASTPLALKATAGLRLLPGHQADSLLKEVKKSFALSPFLTNDNSVTIMDGVDEGLFSWFTVNFLLDRLGGNVEKTVAALDLGGGSTQITFAPSDEATIKHSNPEFLHRISVFHNNLTVYTHRYVIRAYSNYLGLGLMAARKEVLSVGNPDNALVLRSECINPIITGKEWTYNKITYTVKGPENPEYKTIKANANSEAEKRPIVRFTECTKIVKQYVGNRVDKPAELNLKEINAFSYYFDRATEYGLIDPFTGGVVSVKDFQKAAITTCDTPNTEQPFMCLDLTFISVLLQDGFGLKPDTKLNLFKKIDGHELSWALGAVFHILQNGL